MEFVIKEGEQLSEAWFRARAGKASASKFSAIITAAKGELSKSRLTYIDELIAECYIQDANYIPTTEWMQRGIDLEKEAQRHFTERTGIEVTEVGFCINKALKVVGASPDGLIKDEAGDFIEGLEIKCPKPSTHVRYLRKGELPNDYKQQVHGSMAVTGLKSWWFMSYCPGLPALIIKVDADGYTQKVYRAFETFIVEYSEALTEFKEAFN